WLGLAGLVAAFVTSVYIFRAVFIVFFGAPLARGPDDAEAAESEHPAARGPAMRAAPPRATGADKHGRSDRRTARLAARPAYTGADDPRLAAQRGAEHGVRLVDGAGRSAPGVRLKILVPLAVLSVLSIVGGFVETPAALGHVTLFSGFMETALPA